MLAKCKETLSLTKCSAFVFKLLLLYQYPRRIKENKINYIDMILVITGGGGGKRSQLNTVHQ